MHIFFLNFNNNNNIYPTDVQTRRIQFEKSWIVLTHNQRPNVCDIIQVKCIIKYAKKEI